MSRRHLRGFTLIELLVVMAIIGVLISLLLPAVQAAREAARRTQCLNDLMQLGLALQNYDSAWESFPSGVVNETGPIANAPKGFHQGWLGQLLPFMEQSNTFNHINFQLSVYDDANTTVRLVNLRTLVCPSDPAGGGGGGMSVSVSSYAGNHHHTEALIDVTNSGVLFLNSRVRIGDIEDGSSSTVAFGEKRIGTGSDLGWLSGTKATLRNAGTPINGPAPAAVASLPDPVGGFSSYHPGGANFAFADGHIRFLRSTTSLAVYQRMLNRGDGELIFDTP